MGHSGTQSCAILRLLLWARRTSISPRHLTTPGDELGRTVIAIDEAFDQRGSIVIGYRCLDGAGEFSTRGNTYATAAAILGVERLDKSGIIPIRELREVIECLGPMKPSFAQTLAELDGWRNGLDGSHWHPRVDAELHSHSATRSFNTKTFVPELFIPDPSLIDGKYSGFRAGRYSAVLEETF